MLLVIHSKHQSDAGAYHCCQRSNPKLLAFISRVAFLLLKMLWIRFSNLSKSSWGRHCCETWSLIGGDIFLSFLVFNTIRDPCNVLIILASFLTTNLHIFEWFYATCSEAMASRTVEVAQQNIFQKCRKNKRKDSFESYLLETLEALLHDCFRNVVGV